MSTPRTACRPTRRSMLRADGVIDQCIRTVHHVDDFTSPSLVACQDRSIVEPDHVLCVSQPWIERLATSSGSRPSWSATASIRGAIGRAGRPSALREGRPATFAVLTVGGIEPRKGSLTLVEGRRLRDLVPERDPLLLIAGGMTLFDYRHERERFETLGRARRRAARARARPAVVRRDRATLSRRGRVRVPLGQGGLRARRTGGARRRAAGRRIGPGRVPGLPGRRDSALFTPDEARRARPRARPARGRPGAGRTCVPADTGGGREYTGTPRPRPTSRRTRRSWEQRDADALEVSAPWGGGYACGVEARGHEIAVDEPA